MLPIRLRLIETGGRDGLDGHAVSGDGRVLLVTRDLRHIGAKFQAVSSRVPALRKMREGRGTHGVPGSARLKAGPLRLRNARVQADGQLLLSAIALNILCARRLQLGLRASCSRLAKHSMWASFPGCVLTEGRCAFVIGFLQITQTVFLLRVSFRIEALRTCFGLQPLWTP